jgi:hypothetical protein
MSDSHSAAAPHQHGTSSGLRAAALTAASAGVLVLAAAAFTLSYAGVHAIARQAGVTVSLARIYPPAIDALVVVASAAVLALRGAGPVARCYAWLSLLVLLAAAAGADALHAAGTRIPHRASEIAAAIIPWVLLLAGFGLLAVMLRHGRPRRAAAPAAARLAGGAPAGHAPAAVTMTIQPPAVSGTALTADGPAAAAVPADPAATQAAADLPEWRPAGDDDEAPAERPWVPWTTYPPPSAKPSSAEPSSPEPSSAESLASEPLAAGSSSAPSASAPGAAEDPGPAGPDDPDEGAGQVDDRDSARLPAVTQAEPGESGQQAAEAADADDSHDGAPVAAGGAPDAGPASFDRLRSGPTPPAD